MKKILFFLALLSLMVLINGQINTGLSIPKDAKIGLSLSGGGAKGFSHIGVLKVIDSLGIKIDYISGTSMGAIVGGLYASGYTAKDIEKIVLDTDFYNIIANEKTRQESTFFNKSNEKYILNVPIKNGKVNVLPKAISTGQKNIYMLKELFKNVSAIEDFSQLPIPFMCIGTNLESGNLEIFEKGDLVSAIMASSAFPSLMDPVKINDSLYIDGAMTINYPSKPLKDKGMDIVIGVDLSQPLSTRQQLNSVVDILNQVIDFGIKKETKNQYQYTDINIHPNLKGYSATSYGDKKLILDLGYKEALNYTSTLSRLPKRDKHILRAPTSSIFSNIYKIDSLILENNNIYTQNYVRGKMNLTMPAMVTYGGINKMIDKLYATNNYSLINYDIIRHNDSNYLKLIVTEDTNRMYLRFGLHYDEIFKTGLLINATVKRLIFNNSTISFDGIVGDKPRYYFNYFIDNGYLPGFGAYSSGMSFDLRDYESRIYDRWTWFRNEIYIQSIWRDKYAIGGGISHDYFKADEAKVKIGNFFNPYIFIKSDTQDDKDFPTKGVFLEAETKFLDIFIDHQEKKAIQTKANVHVNIPFGKLFSYRLSLFGGFTVGEELSDFYQYRPGAIFEQKLGNFVSFSGLNFGEIKSNNLLTASNNFQFKVYKNYFVIGNVSLLNSFDYINVDNVLKIDEISAGLSVGYKSPFGQIKINYSKAFNDKNNGLFSVILGHWF